MVFEKRITREVDDVSIPTMKSWIEKIPELVRDYKLEYMEHGQITTIFYASS